MPDRHANQHCRQALYRVEFGPRGLATIVFAVLVLDEKLPGNDTIILAAGWTALRSIIAHGVSANPLVHRMAIRSATEAEDRAHTTG